MVLCEGRLALFENSKSSLHWCRSQSQDIMMARVKNCLQNPISILRLAAPVTFVFPPSVARVALSAQIDGGTSATSDLESVQLQGPVQIHLRMLRLYTNTAGDI